MKKEEILMNKPVSLGLSILELSKIIMCDFQYDYTRPKYDRKAKLCYMDTDGCIVYIKTDYIYKDIVEDVENKFDTSNYELDRPLLKKKKIEIVLGSMKGELREKNHDKNCSMKSKNLQHLNR